MDAEAFDQFMEKRFDDIRQMLVTKNSIEYAPKSKGVSRFHNFEVGAALNGKTIEETLWGFATKHIVSVSDMVKDGPLEHSLPKWDEKIGDITVYMLLLHAMVTDAHDNVGENKSMIDAGLAAYRAHVEKLGSMLDDESSDISEGTQDEALSYEEDVAGTEECERMRDPLDPTINRPNVVSMHTDPRDEKAKFFLHTEYGRPPAGASSVGIGIEVGDHISRDEASEKIDDSDELPDVELKGGDFSTTVNVNEIHIHGSEASDEHKAWLASVTPPRGGAERNRNN